MARRKRTPEELARREQMKKVRKPTTAVTVTAQKL